ncbi:MAG: hypothetical protein WA071_09375 [Undibacterium umbellatum]|uniref:hypothetical protein n=1 Tax=Undibacterium umbellatum TaxID=2762300 RepID=UPI003BB63028
MTTQDLPEVLKQLRVVRRADFDLDLTNHIRELLSKARNEEDISLLRSELFFELQRHKHFDEAFQQLQAEVQRAPDDPYPSLSLAEHFHYYDINLEESLRYIALAIKKAKIDGTFMYQSLGVQARLAIETGRWELLEETLHALTSYEHTPGNADVFPESDFLERIPLGAVTSLSIDAYQKRLNYLRSIKYSTFSGAGVAADGA